jgi:hypothetical protein
VRRLCGRRGLVLLGDLVVSRTLLTELKFRTQTTRVVQHARCGSITRSHQDTWDTSQNHGIPSFQGPPRIGTLRNAAATAGTPTTPEPAHAAISNQRGCLRAGWRSRPPSPSRHLRDTWGYRPIHGISRDLSSIPSFQGSTLARHTVMTRPRCPPRHIVSTALLVQYYQ